MIQHRVFYCESSSPHYRRQLDGHPIATIEMLTAALPTLAITVTPIPLPRSHPGEPSSIAQSLSHPDIPPRCSCGAIQEHGIAWHVIACCLCQ